MVEPLRGLTESERGRGQRGCGACSRVCDGTTAAGSAGAALPQLVLRPNLQIREAQIDPLLVMLEGEGVAPIDGLILQSDPACSAD